ncbi:Pentatricopeptide repeat [Macleaya cordata]|uniref:Pentatricopeptide repeat n=1 Tax=Macleaya cordata TaxID=56857 RepID=A0A200QRY0_MACCD|nr:Pentatricopeptide repeat [Macleaya cordata]
MINESVRNGRLIDARKLFDHNPNSRDIITWNSMIAGYVKSNQIHNAQELFDIMPHRDVVSWNTMLMGFQRINDSEKLVKYFIQMGRIGLNPTEFTLSTVISAISNMGSHVLIPQIHARVVNLGLTSSVFVGSALIGSYVNLGRPIVLSRLFDEISGKDVTSWNALISGYMNLGLVDEGRRAFESMPERNVVTWTTLVNGYIYNKKLDEARFHFNEMPEKNVVTWTVMISGYERNDRFLEALELLVSMRRSGFCPNEFTLSSILSACAGCSSLLFGMQVHSSIIKSGQPVDVILSSSLVDMYAKCGDIDAAIRVFESIPSKNLVSWNSIIGGFAGHGLGTRALEEFERMKNGGIRPDEITLVHVLSACARGGLVEEGEKYFEEMEREYGIKAGIEHFACMVDLFGRAGQLEKAVELIRRMPFEPDVVIWGALLGACGMHSSLDLGLFAAEEIYKLEQDHPAVYSLLTKIHGEKGVWNMVTELRKMMNENGARKQKAGSWIESLN